jgi:hypothetical protein
MWAFLDYRNDPDLSIKAARPRTEPNPQAAYSQPYADGSTVRRIQIFRYPGFSTGTHQSSTGYCRYMLEVGAWPHSENPVSQDLVAVSR